MTKRQVRISQRCWTSNLQPVYGLTSHLFCLLRKPKLRQSKHFQLGTVTFERPLRMKETGMQFIMQYTMGLSQSFCHTEKHSHTHKNAVILKGNIGITHVVSPVYNNLAVVFFFIILLSMTLWYSLICRELKLKAKMSNVKAYHTENKFTHDWWWIISVGCK